MLVVDISLNRDNSLGTLAIIRLKPKHTPEIGEICIYEFGWLQPNDQFSKIGKTQWNYGDVWGLVNHVTGLLVDLQK